MEGMEISNIIEYTDIIPERFQITLSAKQEFLAFSPISKLISTSKQKINFKVLENNLKLGLAKLYIKLFPNNRENYSPTIKIIPLHNFTVSNIPQKMKSNYDNPFFIKILKLLFIPRGYYVNDSGDAKNFPQLSPFVQMIRCEEDDDIFNNPAMEAVIDYKWLPARNYFLQLFPVYILFSACFATICGTYVAHLEATGYLCEFLLILIVVFYYLGYYLLMVEYGQLEHHGWRHYFKFFNCIDLASIIIAIIVMSVYVTPTFSTENTFANVVTTQKITAIISFTMLLLWIEFVCIL